MLHKLQNYVASDAYIICMQDTYKYPIIASVPFINKVNQNFYTASLSNGTL
jgi:hypothetical protein